MEEFITSPAGLKEYPIFKYTKEEHARSMVEDGEIRISPLSSFRDTEMYGAEIGDYQEGASSVEAKNFILTNDFKTQE